MTPPSHPARLGTYLVTGEGNSGTFFYARHASAEEAARQGGEVLLQVLDPELLRNPHLAERLRQQIAGVGGLNHPGLPALIDRFSDQGSHVLVWQRVGGAPLSSCIGLNVGPLPWYRAWPLFKPLVEALAALHEAGFVHGSFRPGRVVLRPDGGAALQELGIGESGSKEGQEEAPESEAQNYAAPGRDSSTASMDPRADVYALGVLLCEMLTGRQPVDGQLPSLDDFPKDLPEGVFPALSASMSTDPALRPGSAGILRALLAPAGLQAQQGAGEQRADLGEDEDEDLLDTDEIPAVPRPESLADSGPAETGSAETVVMSAARRAETARRTRPAPVHPPPTEEGTRRGTEPSLASIASEPRDRSSLVLTGSLVLAFVVFLALAVILLVLRHRASTPQTGPSLETLSETAPSPDGPADTALPDPEGQVLPGDEPGTALPGASDELGPEALPGEENSEASPTPSPRIARSKAEPTSDPQPRKKPKEQRKRGGVKVEGRPDKNSASSSPELPAEPGSATTESTGPKPRLEMTAQVTAIKAGRRQLFALVLSNPPSRTRYTVTLRLQCGVDEDKWRRYSLQNPTRSRWSRRVLFKQEDLGTCR
ncbi:MAG: protein kinase, partial [Myxococcota bacterium]|nr:protein kinase [Myxococcota bacterium]